DSTALEGTTLVPHSTSNDSRNPNPNQPQNGSGTRTIRQDGTLGEPQVEIRCISDFWREALRGWDDIAKRRVLSSFEGSPLNGHMERWIKFASSRGINPLQSGSQVVGTFASFLEDFLVNDNKGRKRIKPLERPEGTLT